MKEPISYLSSKSSNYTDFSGVYSTSIFFQYAMDPTNDVMLAYEMNGHPLSPDHGYPIRSVIPGNSLHFSLTTGFVGGRCVKWVSKIWVSKSPSTNHYRTS